MNKMRGVLHNEHAMEHIARKYIKTFDPSLLQKPQAIPIEAMIEKNGLTLMFQRIRKNKNILGETAFDNMLSGVYDDEEGCYETVVLRRGTIVIESTLADNPKMDGRLRYTCAHEFAHWILHQSVYAGTQMTATMIDEGVKELEGLSDFKAKLERQADMLAAALLMPKNMIKMGYHECVVERLEPIGILADVFNVSRQAMEIRLKPFMPLIL